MAIMENEKVNMKEVKFDQMVKEIQTYLDKPRGLAGMYCVAASFMTMERNIKVPSLFVRSEVRRNVYYDILEKTIFDFDESLDLLETVGEVLRDKTASNKPRYSKNLSYSWIFWLLFMAAIDEEIYNNELSTIVDLAYCLKFNEPMMRDWCKVIDYILLGNTLCKESELELETAEGNEYFLHNHNFEAKE